MDIETEQVADAVPPDGESQSGVKRGEPDIPEDRKLLVAQMTKEVQADKKHWAPRFKKMREDQDFAAGKQWKGVDNAENYQANITLRHIQQRTAALYARNPTAVPFVREKILNTEWDGTHGSLQAALQTSASLMAMVQQGAGGPEIEQQLQSALAVMRGAQETQNYKKQMKLLGKTLKLVFDYSLDEQQIPFVSGMKMTVRRACTTGVGYVKLGFQRALQPDPDVAVQLNDATEKLATLEAIAADMADEKTKTEDVAEVEQLRLIIQDLQAQPELLVREGVVFDYPESTAIIPDRKTRQLRNFIGSDHVSQEYFLTPDEIQKIYNVDIGHEYNGYRPGTTEDPNVSPTTPNNESYLDQGYAVSWVPSDEEPDRAKDTCAVWEIYNRLDGLVYVVCDGYKDFLKEPAAPDVWMERFYPWFPVVLNEVDNPKHIFPPSDVQLIKHQQQEYNRLREGLREHRIANRPCTVTAAGMLSENDREALLNRPGNALVELNGLNPGQDVGQLLAPLKPPGVDPNLYEVNGIFDDILRVVGVQEANLGVVGGGTATESSIAESARQSSLSANVDDLDDCLTQLARATGQVLLGELAVETVKEIVGPGAIWPQLSRDQIAKELFLQIEAGSTGRPNQAQEIQNFERLAPLLMQIPGISPEMLAREGIRRLDDRLKLEDLYDQNALSVAAMNQVAGAVSGPGAGTGPQSDPAQQAAQGAQNAPAPDAPAGASSAGTAPPTLQ